VRGRSRDAHPARDAIDDHVEKAAEQESQCDGKANQHVVREEIDRRIQLGNAA
jgi:hypothetical protein